MDWPRLTITPPLLHTRLLHPVAQRPHAGLPHRASLRQRDRHRVCARVRALADDQQVAAVVDQVFHPQTESCLELGRSAVANQSVDKEEVVLVEEPVR